MTTRDTAPVGAPCWADLWTSDVEGSRKFYSELFGWEALAPSPEFGGYFMWSKEGLPVAGGMGEMGEMKADNAWKIYFATDDIEKTVAAAEAEGAKVSVPPAAVATLGSQAVLVAPDGSPFGLWQPGDFHGFSLLEVPGTASWFELHTGDYDRSLHFYRGVFHWNREVVSEGSPVHYSMMTSADGGDAVAGVMYAGERARAKWSIYWEVAEIGASVAKLKELGGTLLVGPETTPYGVLAEAADPAGATFKLRTRP